MRPLNRPMFKMGGPIKQGIMDGMKEPQAINTVGSPLAPTDSSGRQGYALPLLAFAPAAAATAARFLAPRAIMGGLRSLAGGFRSTKTISPFDTGLTKIQRLRNILPTGRFLNVATPKMRPGASFQYTPAPLRLSEAIRSPQIIGKAIRENPGTAFLAAGQVKNIPDIASGAFDVGKSTVQGAANYLLGTEFGKDKLPEGGEGSELKRVDDIGAGEGTTGGSVTGDPKKVKQIQDDRIAKTKQRYYELMGLDKMKKESVYDSLIDASKIVSEEGGDLKGAIKSGTLQSRIIDAISKNLDKSADIKRQIDAAVLKGEIQKDIASADTTDKRLKEARIKQLNRAEKQAGASGQIAAVVSSDGIISGAQTAAILRADGITYDAVLQDKLYNNFKKDNPAADEIDFMISKGAGLDDGRYVIGARLVEKKGNEVAFIV